jgi:hypothetical protein
MSEIETLRRRAEWAESQLRAREVEQAQRKANELAAAQTTQNETESAERKSALEAEIEKPGAVLGCARCLKMRTRLHRSM